MAEVTLFKSREDILAEMLTQLQGAVPDVYVGEDGILYIKFAVEAGQFENAYLANQLVLQDMFIQTASLQGLRQHGIQYSRYLKEGTRSVGTVRFEGEGGTYIPVLTEIAYDPGGGLDPIYFRTTIDTSIPSTGVPTAPVITDGGAGGQTGTYEYVVTFLTAEGETLPSAESTALTIAAKRINVAIPVGGPGTIGRRIYRDKNGANDYRLVTTINDNTTTTYADNISDATVASATQVPTEDTAHRVSVSAEAVNPGVEGNVAIGTITDLVNAPGTLIGVYNTTAFTGGTDQEDTEEFRTRLLNYVRSPQTGSPVDIKGWAEDVSGVDTATVFNNNNNGTPQNGHVTVRIAGPGGTVPSGTVVTAVSDALNSLGMANITFHVTTFTQVAVDVTVDVTTSGTFTISDVTATVQQAIQDYLNNLNVGETVRVAGITDAVFGLPGIADVVVVAPASNQAIAADSKAVPGTISVS